MLFSHIRESALVPACQLATLPGTHKISPVTKSEKLVKNDTAIIYGVIVIIVFEKTPITDGQCDYAAYNFHSMLCISDLN